MWIRLRFDSSARDLAAGMLACCRPLGRDSLEYQAEQHWSESGRAVICLSVRSGFDLLLSALRLPAKSEILMSAVTVPDIVDFKRHAREPLPACRQGKQFDELTPFYQQSSGRACLTQRLPLQIAGALHQADEFGAVATGVTAGTFGSDLDH